MKVWKRYVWLLMVIFALFFVFTVQAQEEALRETRKEKAIQLGLSDWVDEEGYLKDDFYEGKSDKVLSDMGIDGLVRTWSEEELEAYVYRLNLGISLYAVTKYEKVSQINPSTGNYLYTGIFEVDGRLAFCIERSAATPAKGSETGSWVAVTNENLRKVLYYGYNGPQAKGYTYVETALAAGEANGDGDNSLGRSVLAEIKAYGTPPSSFKVWKVETNGGTTQDLAFYTVEEKGYLQLKKVSGNPEAVAGNGQYSLAGAKYGVYSNAEATVKVGELTIGEMNVSESIALDAGTYYVKEILEPLGYQLNTEIKNFKIVAAQTTVGTMINQPQMLVPDVLLRKQDAETGEFELQSGKSFGGAQFQVNYYNGDYEAGVDPAEQGVKPDRQWIFETDEEGKIYYEEAYLISGDELWQMADGSCALPFGSITVQEIQAPEGYQINPEVFVRKISSDADEFEMVIVPETSTDIKLEIQKTDEIGFPVAGAEFTLYFDKACTQVMQKGVTGNDGKLMFGGLEIKSNYYLKETCPPEGYLGDSKIHGIYTEEGMESTTIFMKITNRKMKRLPDTGAAGVLKYICLGSVCCMAALKKKRRK